jgi:UDP-N-acetyl-D-galactosamine dehydrogenase
MNHPAGGRVKVAIIGLGYVGLPLLVEFSRHVDVVGFDINQNRINDLSQGLDETNELDESELALMKSISLTANPTDIADCNVYIMTVPTPIDDAKQPDLGPLLSACETVGDIISSSDIVVFESTVYPGCTETHCVSKIEKVSGLSSSKDFFYGYSPERINPGDRTRKLPDIVKVVSGSTPAITDFLSELYGCIISAGVYRASSVKVAEAAKVIENIQRDVNIALVNELSVILDALEVNTFEVLKAAGTKWNFLSFAPGLVGGHCIGVDPYYLKHAAQVVGVHPELIGSARRINDSYHEFAARKLIKQLIKLGHPVPKAKILVLGYTFKENCPDIRNTRVTNLIDELVEYGCSVEICDPWVRGRLHEPYSDMLHPIDNLLKERFNAIVLAVPHSKFLDLGLTELRSYGVENSVFFDLKGSFIEASPGYISL